MLVIIAATVAVIDPRSIVSVFVCIAPVFVEMSLAAKQRREPKDSQRSDSSIEQ